MDLNLLKNDLRSFARERDWDQFHSPKNLCMAIESEAGELVEVFQWLKEEESMLNNISPAVLNDAKEEIADIFIYLIRLSDKLDIDIENAVNDKLKLNEIKYPVGLSKGNALKYNKRNG
jgi:NTP pyrophosphatase (non-canonical NTP hydrolase)